MSNGASASSGSSTLASNEAPLGIDVDVDSLHVMSGAFLSTVTTGGAPGGDIRIVATDILIDATGAETFTGIGSRSAGIGPGGKIDVTASTLHLANGAAILATSSDGTGGDIAVHVSGAVGLSNSSVIVAQARGAGNGGSVTIAADSIDLTGTRAAISSDTIAAGNGGGITLDVAQLLRVADTAFISTTTRGAGNAGDVFITAADITLDGAGKIDFTGVGANTQAGEAGAGRGGTVNISTGTLRVVEGAGVATQTFGGENGGNIAITAGNVSIDASDSNVQTGLTAAATGAGVDGGRILLTAPRVQLRRGQISASAEGNGGEITINATDFVHLFNQSEIVAEAVGNGGNVTIDPNSVVLQNSRISANAIQGNGGNILIRADAFIPSADPGTAVTASSEFGLVGNVEINAPDTEIAGALVQLPASLATGTGLLPQCGANLRGSVSSFVATGRGGSPLVPAGWSADFSPVRR
jgi:large exoprotein involved in heme utilization and adhesion